jgi:hypothetical protein
MLRSVCACSGFIAGMLQAVARGRDHELAGPPLGQIPERSAKAVQ